MEGTLKIAYDMVRTTESLKTLTSLQNPICICLLIELHEKTFLCIQSN